MNCPFCERAEVKRGEKCTWCNHVNSPCYYCGVLGFKPHKHGCPKDEPVALKPPHPGDAIAKSFDAYNPLLEQRVSELFLDTVSVQEVMRMKPEEMVAQYMRVHGCSLDEALKRMAP